MENEERFIFLFYEKNWSIESIESIINFFSYKHIKNIANTYKMNSKKIKMNNRRSQSGEQKFKEGHISFIKEYWHYDISMHYTLF